MDNLALHEPVLYPMGLTDFSWYVLEIDMQWTGQKPGDIDILGGPLAWQEPSKFAAALETTRKRFPDSHPRFQEIYAAREVAFNYGIARPPLMDYLVGVEVKCSYCEDGVARAAKSSRKKREEIQDQIDGLLAFGLDRVALLDIVATHPADGQGLEPWLIAARQSDIAYAAVQDVLNTRLRSDTPAGHFVCPIGAIVGGNEGFRGAGAPRMVRAPQENPLRSEPAAREIRSRLVSPSMEFHLTKLERFFSMMTLA